MKEYLSKLISGKKLVILGFGKEGRSTLSFIRSILPQQQVTIIDDNPAIADDAQIRTDQLITFLSGKEGLNNISNFEIVIKSPGIPGSAFPPGFDKSKISSQTSLFLEVYGSQVIGVTGTKGKSTTSSLIHHILKESGRHSILVGNIGLPPFEGIQEITPDSTIVMELSSHQLEFIQRSPHIALLLNIFQEHLDHYGSYEDYQNAKMNIGKFQSKDDYLIYCRDNLLLESLVERDTERTHHLLPYSLHTVGNDGILRKGDEVWLKNDGKENLIYDSSTGFKLLGEHNFSNLMAAAAACFLAGLTSREISNGASSFSSLEHRLEYVGNYNGVNYYNDSIATIPEAAIEAVNALKNVDTLILGGYDRGIDYHVLYQFLSGSGISNLIFVGEAGKRMRREITENIPTLIVSIYTADNYDEVVKIADKVTSKGKICLLSPAASSYDMFKNFEHRGNIYKKNVRSLGSSH